MKTKVGLVSDTHGRIPQNVYAALSDCSIILHAGDYHEPLRIESLGWSDDATKPAPTVIAVCGNCDWDESYPAEQYFDIDGVKIYLCHGHRFAYAEEPWDTAIAHSLLYANKHKLPKEKPDVIVFGHLHKPMDFVHQGVRFINPGSPTRPRNGKPTLAVMTIDNSVITYLEWFEFDSTY
ncbi:metallophosphoesterase family protein [Candidatus Sumerlaeota bacterium]|nr:metallophosphoesterase family protein [Candidatus Sumerlaeales bacterium]NLD61799.1 metallophosphoesterase family protein [Candidatus Sumerlaeota bacterium]